MLDRILVRHVQTETLQQHVDPTLCAATHTTRQRTTPPIDATRERGMASPPVLTKSGMEASFMRECMLITSGAYLRRMLKASQQ